MDTWQVIVGLGNPGREYSQTRHNAGFMVVDQLAARWHAQWRLESRFEANIIRTERNGQRLLLCRPETFMNASGRAVAPLARFYRVKPESVLVVVDDADLNLGTIRMRPEGSSGGHHGLESIETHLGGRHFPRLRVGIGRNQSETGQREITGYVLGRFENDERDLLKRVLERAADQVECWIANGVAQAMNQFNGSTK